MASHSNPDVRMYSQQGLPGIRDLMQSPVQPFANPATTAQAADNVRTALSSGLGAIGDLLWHAAQHDEFPYHRKTLADLGMLLKQLAEIDDVLAETMAVAGQQDARRAPWAGHETPMTSEQRVG